MEKIKCAEKSQGQRSLGRFGCRWEDNIKVDLRETGHECVDWAEVTQDKVKWQASENAVINV
jgi:hypothetical protein